MDRDEAGTGSIDRRSWRFATNGVLVALVAVGVLRPQLPEVLRQHWTEAIVFLAVSAALLRMIPPRREDREERALTAVFCLVLAAMYLQPQRVASDGIFYFTPLHSLIVDGDLYFENEYRVLGAPEGYFHPTSTGRLPNNFSLGPALIWAPFYLVAHGLGLLGLFRPTGFGYPYFTAVATTTAAAGFLGVIWFYRLARVYFEARIALAASLLLWLGSFHLWYMVYEPSMSHALAMASVSGFLLLCQRGFNGPERALNYRAVILAGAAGGVMMLIRWQNALFLPVGLLMSWKHLPRPRWRPLGLAAVAASAMFLPQTIYWKLLYGRFLLVPQGASYLGWSAPEWEAVLFSSRHGLFAWSPLLWVGALGFVVMLRRAPAFGWSFLAAFAMALYVNASVHDWWAGASFGARRFDGALPGFGLGLAGALERLLPWIRRHTMATAALLLAPFVFWNMGLMAIYFQGAVPRDGPVSFRLAAADAIELVYRWTGYPFSLPGALAEKTRSGAPLSVYDLAGARHLSHNVDIRMGDTDALYLGPGWSLPRRRREATFREGVPEGAFVYVALREPAPYRLELEGRWNRALVLLVNRNQVGDIAPVGGEGKGVLDIPARAFISGVNEIQLTSPGGSRFALSRLRLLRRGPS
ncbi:MAG: hypothetical protein ACE5JI_05645 [Acidobacteriota bacterium]